MDRPPLTSANPERGRYQLTKRTPPGSPPGTLIAHPDAATPVVSVLRYGPDSIDEVKDAQVGDLKNLIGGQPVTWVNVSGLGDVELIRRIGADFGLHRLALEDVVSRHQRPKVEEFDTYLFVVTRMLIGEDRPDTEQVAMFVGKDYLLTLQEHVGDCFDPIRERLHLKKGRIRDRGADYLAYALIDAVIDGYFPLLELYGERVEDLENAVLSEPSINQTRQIHHVKRDLLTLRRAIWPQREMVSALTREQSDLVSEGTQVYLRDCYDHTIQLIDVIETYREIASGLVDVYLSSVSARLNEIMKVLTIIATVFIPLSFVASLYGMNFDTKSSPWNMPELAWRFGYPFSLAIMAAIAGGLLYYFWRRRWIGRGWSRRRRQPFANPLRRRGSKRSRPARKSRTG